MNIDTAYLLNHWTLLPGPDGLGLEGRLHGRPGFPDGIPVCTSTIFRWEFSGGSFFFETENSLYRGNLAEYVRDTVPLSELLSIDGGGTDPSSVLAEAEMELQKLSAARIRRCLNLMQARAFRRCIILRWHGCDIPYLKWTLSLDESRVWIDDHPAAIQEVVTGFRTYDGSAFRVRCTAECGDHSVPFPFLDQETCLILENDGAKAIRIFIGESSPLTVRPGETKELALFPSGISMVN